MISPAELGIVAVIVKEVEELTANPLPKLKVQVTLDPPVTPTGEPQVAPDAEI